MRETYDRMKKRQRRLYHELMKHPDVDHETIRGFELFSEFEKNEAIDEDITGDGFIYEMFRSELLDRGFAGHDPETIDRVVRSLGYTMPFIYRHPALRNGFDKAVLSF